MGSIVIKIIIFAVLLIALLFLAAMVFIPKDRSVTHMVYLQGTLAEIWAVYTDYGSQSVWRNDVVEIKGLAGETGSRVWTETTIYGIDISFQETDHEPPYLLKFMIISDGFSGAYEARFEQADPDTVKGVFTETISYNSFIPKLMGFLFVNPKTLITEYAKAAQAEVNRRRQLEK